MELSASALCKLEDVKDYLGVDHSKQDGILIELINEVSDDCERYCNRTFFLATYTAEKYNGDGTDTLLVANYPITTVTELKLYTGAAAELAANYTIYHEYGKVVLAPGLYFPVSNREVSITYSAGYNTIAALPMSLRMAVVRAVAFKFREQDQSRLGLTSLAQGDQIQSFTLDRYPRAVLEVWTRFRRRSIVQTR